MSAGLQSLLNAQSATSLRGARQAAAPSAGGVLDGMLGALDRVEETRGPLAAEFLRAFTEGQFRKRGIPVSLKSKGERELEQRQSQLALAKLKDLERSNQVRSTVGLLLDGAQTPVNQIFGGDDTRTLEDAFGTRLDASILQRPEDLVRISKQLAQVPGFEGFALSRSDLLLNEFTSSFAQQTVEQRGAEKAGQQVKAQRDLEATTEFQQELQAGEGLAADSFTQRLESAGESVGQDLTPGITGDDFDEARGSAEVVKSFLDQGQEFAGRGLGPEVLLGMLQGPVGQRVGQVLRGGDVKIAEDGKRILVPVDGVFNDEQAISNFIALIDKVSELTGRPRTEIIRSMGLEFDDFDQADIDKARADLGI